MTCIPVTQSTASAWGTAQASVALVLMAHVHELRPIDPHENAVFAWGKIILIEPLYMLTGVLALIEVVVRLALILLMPVLLLIGYCCTHDALEFTFGLPLFGAAMSCDTACRAPIALVENILHGRTELAHEDLKWCFNQD